MRKLESFDFRWPLTPEGRSMSFTDLFEELLATISEINSRREWPLVVLVPMPGDVTLNRDGGVLTARCQWVRKSEARDGRG